MKARILVVFIVLGVSNFLSGCEESYSSVPTQRLIHEHRSPTPWQNLYRGVGAMTGRERDESYYEGLGAAQMLDAMRGFGLH